MKSWDKFLDENIDKKAILVEGKYDYDPFANFFVKKSPEWERNFVIVAVGNKRKVLEKLKHKSVAFGIVDNDTWGKEEIKKAKDEHGENLFVIPRYCMENYIVIPKEIKVALPPEKRDVVEFSKILKNLEKWKTHAALWRAVTPLWSGLVSLNFNQALLPENISEIPTESAIKSKLKEWNSVLDIDKTLEKFEEEKERFFKMDNNEFIKIHVHGKHFFDNEIFPIVSAAYDQLEKKEMGKKEMGKKEIKKGLFQNISLPEDLQPIFNKLG